LEFGVGRPSHTTLIVYNILGQKVRSLVDESLNSGTYQVTWDAKNDRGEKVPSGVYFYRLTSGDVSEVRKMILLR
jgi:flagellar hook assembly protein FlgD